MKSKIVKALQILAILVLVAVIIIDWERFLYKSVVTLLIKGIIFVGGWFLFGLLGKDDSSEPNDAREDAPEADGEVKVPEPKKTSQKELSSAVVVELVLTVVLPLAIVATTIFVLCLLL